MWPGAAILVIVTTSDLLRYCDCIPLMLCRTVRQGWTTWWGQGGDTDPLFFISLIVPWRPSRKAGARGPARPIPARTPRVVWLSYTSCDSLRKRGLVAFPLLPLPAPAFCR